MLPIPSPPLTRHHSSSLNPHHSLGRRRSSSCLQYPPLMDIQEAVPAVVQPDSPKASMIVLLASRILQWLHLQPEHSLSWSNPSTPRTSSEEYILPLSASAQKTTFGDVTAEKVPIPVHHFPSVCIFLFQQSYFLLIILPLFNAGPCSNRSSDLSTPNINCSRVLLHVHPPHIPFLAPDN